MIIWTLPVWEVPYKVRCLHIVYIAYADNGLIILKWKTGQK